MACADFLSVKNGQHEYTVNNSNKIWHVQIYIVYNM